MSDDNGNNIIRFPTGQAEVNEPEPERPEQEAFDFEHFLYHEVVDFQHHVADLDTLAHDEGEAAFWQEIERLRERINQWKPGG